MFGIFWFLNDISSQTSLQTGFIIVITFLLFVHLLRSLLDIPLVDNISDKCIFITGCDTGFGYLLALKLDELGCSVFAACLTQDGANRLSEASDGRIVTSIMDVTDSDSITPAKNVIEEHLSKKDKGKSYIYFRGGGYLLRSRPRLIKSNIMKPHQKRKKNFQFTECNFHYSLENPIYGDCMSHLLNFNEFRSS